MQLYDEHNVHAALFITACPSVKMLECKACLS